MGTIADASIELTARQIGSQKAAETRQARKVADRLKFHREHWSVNSYNIADDLFCAENIDAEGKHAVTLEQVVNRCLTSFRQTLGEFEAETTDEHDSVDTILETIASNEWIGGRDMMVMRAGRIVAVIRADADGNPVPTIF